VHSLIEDLPEGVFIEVFEFSIVFLIVLFIIVTFRKIFIMSFFSVFVVVMKRSGIMMFLGMFVFQLFRSVVGQCLQEVDAVLLELVEVPLTFHMPLVRPAVAHRVLSESTSGVVFCCIAVRRPTGRLDLDHVVLVAAAGQHVSLFVCVQP
jgi:hypothetical protein